MKMTDAEGQAAPVSPGVSTPPRPASEHSAGPVEAEEQRHGEESGGSTDGAGGMTTPASGTAAVSGTAAQLPVHDSSADSGTTPDHVEDTSASASPARGVRCLLACGALGSRRRNV